MRRVAVLHSPPLLRKSNAPPVAIRRVARACPIASHQMLFFLRYCAPDWRSAQAIDEMEVRLIPRSRAPPTLTLPPNGKRERDVIRYGPLGS